MGAKGASAGMGAFILIAACTHKPDEVPPPPDTGASTPVVRIAGHQGDAATHPTPVAPDAGRTPVLAFCQDAYAADTDRMKDKCSANDASLTQSMARAAAGLCDHDVRLAIDRSRASFDPDAASKCVEMLHDKALEQTSETDTLFGHFPCDKVLIGLQDEGKPCLFSVECKEGLACVGYKIGVDGTCKKPPKAKAACTAQRYGTIINDAATAPHHPACTKDAYCDETACQPRVAAGKACTQADACAGGLSCVNGQCGARGAEGAACAAATDCTFGLWCDRTGDAGAGKCASKHTQGQACMSEDACKGRCEIPKGKDGKQVLPGMCTSVCGSG